MAAAVVNTRKREVSVQKIVSNTVNQAPFHPLGYVKVLAQIAHEPLPPFKARTIFGNERFYYPNLFAYLKYIYSVEGLTGLYRGLGMKMLSVVAGGIAYEKLTIMFDELDETEAKKGDETSFQLFIRHTSREIAAKCWGVVVSHPFHVMALRCMAQFVGGETNYSSWNVYQNTVEIFKGEGVAGFFSGLVPRLLFEASTIALTSSLAYFIKTYVFDEKEIDAFVDAISSIFVSSLTYPLSLVSTVSSVSGSALIAGRPPRMVIYTSWIEAFKHLYENNELKRGSSYFFRIYNPSSMGVKSGFVLNQPLTQQNQQKRKYAA